MTGRPTVRVAIVDDEPMARRTLRELLLGQEGVEIVGEASDGAQAIELLGREDADVVFLDIRMPAAHGFDIVASLPTEDPPLVVFVTAHAEHALRAFEVGALDYLLKPFDDDRFAGTMDRIRHHVAQRRLGVLVPDLRDLAGRLATLDIAGRPTTAGRGDEGAGGSFETRLAVRVGRKIEFVAVEEIDWIEAEDYYVRIHAGGRSHLLRESLTRLEGRLDPGEFIRVHRSAIVRISRVKHLLPLDHGDAVLVLGDGTRVRVSRTRRRHVDSRLGLD